MNYPKLPKAFWNPRQTRARVVSHVRLHQEKHLKEIQHDVGLSQLLKERRRG